MVNLSTKSFDENVEDLTKDLKPLIKYCILKVISLFTYLNQVDEDVRFVHAKEIKANLSITSKTVKMGYESVSLGGVDAIKK